MSSLIISIINPLRRKKDSIFKHLFLYQKRIFGHKSFEAELIFDNSWYHLFEFRLILDFDGRDHTGPEFGLTIGPIQFLTKVYDHRHWDYDCNCWEN